MIRVLYSDDDKPKPTFFDKATLAGFEVDWVETWEEAIQKLSSDEKRYEAVILDALGKVDKNSAGEDGTHLRKALDDVKELVRGGYDLCAIIYSGNPGLANIFATEEHPYVSKSAGSGELFKRLKEAIEGKSAFILKQRHPIPFKVFEKGFLLKKYEKTLIDLLKEIEEPTDVSKMEERLYNPCRTLLEGVFHSLIDCGAIPEDFRPNGIVNNSATRILLTRRVAFVPPNDSVQYKTELRIPVRVIMEINTVADNTNPDSHYNSELPPETARYAVNSIINQVLDVLCWLYEFRTKNPSIENNNQLWSEVPSDKISIQGPLEQDDKGNYHCGQYLISYNMVESNKIKIGDVISITEAKETTKAGMKEKYPLFGSKFSVITSSQS
jgi:hypothetical protein